MCAPRRARAAQTSPTAPRQRGPARRRPLLPPPPQSGGPRRRSQLPASRAAPAAPSGKGKAGEKGHLSPLLLALLGGTALQAASGKE